MCSSRKTIQHPAAEFPKTPSDVPAADKLDKNSTQWQELSQRDFIAATAITAIGFPYVVASSALGKAGTISPSNRIATACIGTGGMGINNMKGCMEIPDVQMVAVCDVNKQSSNYGWKGGFTAGREPARQMVDDYYAQQAPSGTYKACLAYSDFRELLDRDDIDAVIVATPDHNHAVISMLAIKKGKHVFCQKPLTYSIYEARMLTEAARKAGVATQMGNQGHAGEGIRLMCEWIWDGAIGHIRQVHAWTNKPIWPQGIDRPKETPPVPDGLDWDLWLGPAPYRPYHPCYLPFTWRGWWDFGTGALGDMGCHIMDPPFWALKLGHPVSIQASSTAVNAETGPIASVVHYDFPARGDMPPVRMTWYDGELKPPRPPELEEGRTMGDKYGNGVIFEGDKGKIMCGCYGENPRLIPETKMKAYKLPPKTIPRSPGIHEEWIRACKAGPAASSNFDNSGPLTETVLLGNLAIRTGKKLYWDGPNMKVTNVPEANKYVRRQYRQGWSL